MTMSDINFYISPQLTSHPYSHLSIWLGLTCARQSNTLPFASRLQTDKPVATGASEMTANIILSLSHHLF